MRALLHLLETITIRIRSHAENDPSPKETQTETMVGPSQAFALLLRVLFAWHANPTGSVRRRLRQRFSAHRGLHSYSRRRISARRKAPSIHQFQLLKIDQTLCMRALLHYPHLQPRRDKPHRHRDKTPGEKKMAGPSQPLAMLLRVLCAWHESPTASVRRKLRQRGFTASCTAQLLAETTQFPPRSATQRRQQGAQDLKTGCAGSLRQKAKACHSIGDRIPPRSSVGLQPSELKVPQVKHPLIHFVHELP